MGRCGHKGYTKLDLSRVRSAPRGDKIKSSNLILVGSGAHVWKHWEHNTAFSRFHNAKREDKIRNGGFNLVASWAHMLANRPHGVRLLRCLA